LQNRFTGNPESAKYDGVKNIRENGLQNRFTEDFKSSDYDGGKNILRTYALEFIFLINWRLSASISG